MKSPTFDEVASALGDKVMAAFVATVDKSRGDLAVYRAALPRFVADQSERGLANWIHDRMWANLGVELQGLADVVMTERGVVREVGVGTNFIIRLKRHSQEGGIQTFPTLAAQEFWAQGDVQPALDGLELVTLGAGYMWMRDEREIGPAVLSLRDGIDEMIWFEEIARFEDGTVAILNPEPVEPTRPTIHLAGEDEATAEQSGGADI